MKRILLLLIIALVALTEARGQLLYEISGNGAKSKSYILGTDHALPVSSLLNIKGLFRCYNRTKAVIGEAVLTDRSLTDSLELLSRYMLYPKGTEEFYSAEEIALIDSALRQDANLTYAQVRIFRPRQVSQLWLDAITSGLYARGDDDQAMDSYFQTQAEIDGKPVYGLESLIFQMKLLSTLTTAEEEARALVGDIRAGRDSVVADYRRFNDLYLSLNLDSIYSENIGQLTEEQRLVLVEERNEKWLPLIADHIRREPCFIAVGCIHLGGRTGLVTALKKKGFTLKPVY